MPVDPKSILQGIRTDNRPLVSLYKGPEKNVYSLTNRADDFVRNWLLDPENSKEDFTPAALESLLVELGQFAHPLSWAHTENDAEAWELERRVLIAKADQGDERANQLLPHMLASDGYQAFSWQPKWYHYGCQSLDVEEKYAASLCATKITRTELEHVKLPWLCFVIRVPKVLQNLTVQGEGLKLVVVNHAKYTSKIAVVGEEATQEASFDQYQLHLLTNNRFRIVAVRQLSDWERPNSEVGYDVLQRMEVEHGELERRQFEILGRFVLGAIISMNDPKAHRQYIKLSPGKNPSLGSPRYGTNNDVVLHKIGRPVKIDVREVIQSYTGGHTDRVSNVRTLVAGHWKSQAHGPKNTLRRWQHVECYWRGKEGDPLIIRPHVLVKEKE